MKTKRGQQSAEQKAWQREAEKVGNRYIVVRSIEQFISIINEYLRNGKTTEE
jgi:hypothetical protein